MKHLKLFEAFNNDVLDVSCNYLTSLDEIPDGIKVIYCQDNKLTSLPKLPDSLIYLECSYNQLTSLPELPDRLQELSCGGNKIKHLPELPNGLTRLIVSGNPIECLIPSKFLSLQSPNWMNDYYNFINSYEGQDKILSRDVRKIEELEKQLMLFDLSLDPEIKKKYEYAFSGIDLGLL